MVNQDCKALIKKVVAPNLGLILKHYCLSFLSSFRSKKQQIAGKLDLDHFFVIDKQSGISIGGYSDFDKKVDQDLVAGMLTAIKSFSESAFNQNQSQSINTISYSNFNIFMHNSFEHFYLAAVINSSASKYTQKRLKHYFKHVSTHLNKALEGKTTEEIQKNEVEQMLSKYFK